MKTKKYIKKPIPVEAVLLTEENIKEVMKWIREETGAKESAAICSKGILWIKTLEGILKASPGKHYIVKGVNGEFYPVEKEIFKKTYEEVKP